MKLSLYFLLVALPMGAQQKPPVKPAKVQPAISHCPPDCWCQIKDGDGDCPIAILKPPNDGDPYEVKLDGSPDGIRAWMKALSLCGQTPKYGFYDQKWMACMGSALAPPLPPRALPFIILNRFPDGSVLKGSAK